MPKIIEDAKSTIISSARTVLAEEGYCAFSLRDIARRSGVSVGTIYNNFSDKEELTAAVMIGDWNRMLAETDRAAAECSGVREGLLKLCSGISAFCALYRNCWAEFSATSKAGDAMKPGRHKMLRSQLTERVENLLKQFPPYGNVHLAPILAETVLAAAMQEDIGTEMLSQLLEAMGY